MLPHAMNAKYGALDELRFLLQYLLQPLYFPKCILDVMLMPKRRGYRYIVATRDDLSRATEGRALKKATAKALAHFFWKHIYCRYRVVIQVVTANGPEVKRAFKILLRRLKIPQIKISPYNSKANGVVE